MNQILNKLERRYSQYAIPNLMTILVFGMGLVFLLDTFTSANPDYTYTLSSLLYFDWELIKKGQIWRIITFLFMPEGDSGLFIIFQLYFYWLIGKALESHWGSFRFNVFYFIGAIGSAISGIFTGYATNEYLNLSMFLAFATLFPDFQVLLFFFLPVKMKFLGWLSGAGLLIMLIIYPWTYKIAILVSMLNFILFFGRDFCNRTKLFFRKIKFRNQNKTNWKNNHWWEDDENNPWKK
ncbi:MAG: rhomboid family intramembrane serine protease [Oscillospiraceae bacterium]|nr:rhomboid family intramembrane serine protease [Oscillospiraceae bacterium]